MSQKRNCTILKNELKNLFFNFGTKFFKIE